MCFGAHSLSNICIEFYIGSSDTVLIVSVHITEVADERGSVRCLAIRSFNIVWLKKNLLRLYHDSCVS